MRIPGLRISLLSFLLACLFSGVICLAEETESAALSYEVKFLLDSSKVLGDDRRLTQSFRELVGIEDTEAYKAFEVLYLETGDQDFLEAGWINRIRWREKKKNDLIERTYKKRYAVADGDLDAAIAQAREDGFTIGGDYEAQVDWGYEKMTLSFSKTTELELPKNSGGLSGMTTGKAESDAAESMPEEEEGAELIAKAQKVGVIHFSRIKGNWRDGDEETEVTVEIWPIREQDETVYITELSFKVKEGSFEKASAKREKMTALLDGEGILLHEDGLKTNRILNAYLRKRPETVSFMLPAALRAIGMGAFSGTAAASVWIPEGTENITGDPFASGDESEGTESKTLLVIGTPGSGADTFATKYGYGFIPE